MTVYLYRLDLFRNYFFSETNAYLFAYFCIFVVAADDVKQLVRSHTIVSG